MIHYDIFIICAYIFILGTAIGSFLNVLIYRIPKNIFNEEKILARQILDLPEEETSNSNEVYSILKPSKCPKCNRKLKYRHNIPIFGWIILKGRCYFCRCKISPQYPIIELLTAIVFVAIFIKYGATLQGLCMLILATVFIPLFFIDLKHQILPDSLTLPLIWVGIIVNYNSVFITLDSSIWGAILGYLSLWSVFWIYKILTGKEGFGYGDFKLLTAIGAWFGYQMLLYTIFASCIIGIFMAIFINLSSKRTNTIAFGPSIILATIFYLLTQDNIYIWYNHMMLIS